MTRSDPVSLYDDDFFAWTQTQAAALRQMTPTTTGIDIDHLAEEIEDLGKRDLREVRSFLRRFIEHIMKLEACSTSSAVLHWRAEARTFHQSAIDAYSPSMRQHLSAERIWQDARKRVRADLADVDIVMGPSESPLDLDDLLTPDIDVDAVLARMNAASRQD